MDKKGMARVFRRLAAMGLAGGMLWCGTLGNVNAATLKDLFDEHYYADRYKDLKDLYGYDREALWNHYVQHGLAEGRPMSGLLNVKKYREQYADLDAAFGNDWDAYLNHYLTVGAKEGRDTGTETEFDAFDYASRYADLQAAYGDDVLALWKHYQSAGAEEGREARSEEVLEAEREAEAEARREEEEREAAEAEQKSQETPKPGVHTERVELSNGGWRINVYNEAGVMIRSTTYFANGKEFRILEYYEDGKLKTNTLFKEDGSFHGRVEYIEYHENGELKLGKMPRDDGSYDIHEYDETGKPIKYTSYNADGTIKQ